jgi:BASS family bile acid:Na+ symporter
MLILIVGGLIIGWLFGGPSEVTRQVLAVNTSMRNVGLCLVIATRAFSTPDVEVAVLAFAALMVPPNMLFTLYHAVKAKRAQKSPIAG